MAQRQTSFARHRQRTDREWRRRLQEYRTQEKHQRLAEHGTMQDAMVEQTQRRREIFEALQPGDELGVLGVPGTVRRKNRRSVTTTLGQRWTLRELGVEDRSHADR